MDLIYRNPALSVLFPILSCGSLLYLRYDINSKQNCKSPIQAQLSDYLLRNKIWSRTAVRRVFNSIGLILPAIALSFITTLKCDTDAVIAMICLCCGFSGFIFSGYNTPNHADLAPAYAGTLFGITNMIGTIPGFLAPQVNTMFIKGHEHEVRIPENILYDYEKALRLALGHQCGIWLLV